MPWSLIVLFYMAVSTIAALLLTVKVGLVIEWLGRDMDGFVEHTIPTVLLFMTSNIAISLFLSATLYLAGS